MIIDRWHVEVASLTDVDDEASELVRSVTQAALARAALLAGEELAQHGIRVDISVEQ